VREINRVESQALEQATLTAIEGTDADQRFTAAYICHLHALWLGEIYAWAGKYRSVNISKDGFMFAAASLIPNLMRQLEEGPLRQYSPCHAGSIAAQSEALAIVHAELILIHPFREGNGRCARMLATLMGLQAGLPALNFSGLRGQQRKRYIAAIQAAARLDYRSLTEVFTDVIRVTVRSAGKAT
jgi:cell filamentation protein